VHQVCSNQFAIGCRAWQLAPDAKLLCRYADTRLLNPLGDHSWNLV
jgi:hypothetical protein